MILKMKDLLNEAPDFSKPRVDDYVRDGNVLFGKIVSIMSHQGKKLAFVKQMKGKFGKAVIEIGYNYNKLKDSGKKNVGRVIWSPK